MVRPVRATLCRVGGVDVLAFVSGEDIFPNASALWAAAGTRPGASPSDYLRNNYTERYLDAVAASAGVPRGSLYRIDGNGDVWMTWLVALDYAGFISPEFRQAVYRLAGERAKQLLSEYRKDDDWNDRRERGKEARRSWERQMDRVPDPAGYGKGFKYGHLTNVRCRRMLGGSAGELKAKLGLRPKDSLRDHLPKTAISMLSFAEDMEAERLAIESSPTFNQAKTLCERVAEITGRAADEIRRLAL